jgi:hypothetical protein
VKKYFDGYVSRRATSRRSSTGSSGKDELLMDNAAIDVERGKLWEAMGNLEQMIHISKKLDEKIEDKANDLDAPNPPRPRLCAIGAVLHPPAHAGSADADGGDGAGLSGARSGQEEQCRAGQGRRARQHHHRRALRTAVTVAQAMTNQRLVLGQITALNTTTANIIDSTSALLKDQTSKIHEQAASSTIPVETLQRAFQNIYDTMDTIDTFKLKALDSMKQTVNTLGRGREIARLYRPRARHGAGAGGA